MQEDYEEPLYGKATGNSFLFPGSGRNSSPSISDIKHCEELSVGDYDDNGMYAPSQDYGFPTYSRQRSGTPLADESMIRDMNYRYPRMDNVDSFATNNIRNAYHRKDPMPVDNSLYVDDLSPIPHDSGFIPHSGRHSPIHGMDREYNIYNSHGEIGYDRYSPVVPENYPNRIPRNMYRNDYYSDTNISPLRYSPLPPNREVYPPKYYSPTPYDYYGNCRCRSPYRSPLSHPSDMEISHLPPPYQEDQRMSRNLSLMNMNEEDFLESDNSYRAKSLICVSDYEDIKKDSLPPGLPPSRTPTHTPMHTPSLTPVQTPTHSPSLTPDHISMSEEMVSTDVDITTGVQVDHDSQPTDQSNLVDAIFASCTPAGTTSETVKETPKSKTKPKTRTKPSRPRNQPIPAKSKTSAKSKAKSKQASKPEAESPEDTKKSPCRDFENGVCSRGAACKYYHDPSKAVHSPDKIPICRDYLNGDCKRERCRFRHPGTHKDDVLMGIVPASSPKELRAIFKHYSSTLVPFN